MSKTKLGTLGLFVGLAVASGAWFAMHVKAQPAAASSPAAEALTAEDRAALKQALDELGVALTQLQANINAPQSGLALTADRQENINSALGGLQTALTGLDSALGQTGPEVAVQPSPAKAEEAPSADGPLVLARQQEDKPSDLLAADQTAQASAAADGFNWSKALLAGFLIAAGAAGLAFYFRLRRKEVKKGQTAPVASAQEAPAAVSAPNSQQA